MSANFHVPGLDASEPQPALLLHSDPSELMVVLEACPGLRWRAASSGPEVLAALEAHRPTVVFSLKHSGFPGDEHRPAIMAPSVRWFHVGGSGVDHLAGYDWSRVTMTTCAGVLAPFLAERAAAALLYLSTRLDETVRSTAERRWEPTRFASLQGKTAVIVGAGAAGTELALRLRPFGLRLVGVRASGEPHPAFDEMHGPGALAELLPRADVLSLHVPLNAATRHLIGQAELERLPAGAILLNSARGAVLEERALPGALDRGLGAAWLDVFEVEPLPVSSPLWSHPRVLITPHQADQVGDYPMRFARRFAELWAELTARRPR
ncbi:Glyoxylate/hydroxypyruvate reductase A [Planctomycetes bacterium Poly30]|uniref:Glyoxylate/hydroxypyruvate reductase A n=1 Tax=Saltatorellus ferox TaxID=2528018 RepID=A0A518EQB4_9BACT|nr:Glyoxylate/hydroxypyruvate reductase A [Planctomycetes bacterium Poly30]